MSLLSRIEKLEEAMNTERGFQLEIHLSLNDLNEPANTYYVIMDGIKTEITEDKLHELQQIQVKGEVKISVEFASGNPSLIL